MPTRGSKTSAWSVLPTGAAAGEQDAPVVRRVAARMLSVAGVPVCLKVSLSGSYSQARVEALHQHPTVGQGHGEDPS